MPYEYWNSVQGFRKFWEKRLELLKEYKNSTFDLMFRENDEPEGKWVNLSAKLHEKNTQEEIEDFVYEVCRRLYETAQQNPAPFPTDFTLLVNEFTLHKWGSFVKDYSHVKDKVIDNYRFNELRLKEKKEEVEIENENLGMAFTFLLKTLGIELNASLFPPGFNVRTKYNNNLPRLLFKDFKHNVLKNRTLGKILHKEKRQDRLINEILGTTDLPRDWTKKLVKKADLDNLQNWKDNHVCSCSVPCHTSSHSDYNQKHTESQEYQRINTKLSGKVSDSELQTLLDALPNCPHSDYNTLKSERDTLKTENTQLKDHKCDCDSKVAQKEQEIINKIITDLELSTERERERERENILEAVITEIKGKINPPQDNSQLSQLQTQLKDKETEISQLKKGNQSQLDLEKLIAQKQAENQALTTAKSNLESQLNEKQKELLTQVLNKSAEVKEKTIKEEIIKVIETSLTSQGIDTKSFKKEINHLSSLTDIEKLQGKYTSQRVNGLEDNCRSATYLNIGLGALSIGSLLILAYLLIKGFKKDIIRVRE